MKTVRLLQVRPWLATACVVAALAVILLAVPISYTRTTGYEVRLSLAGNATGVEQVGTIAKEFKEALHAESVMVTAGRSESLLRAKLGPSPRPFVEAAARAFAGNLTERGIPATASVRPVTERISTNLYAYAAGRIIEIRVNSAGKTDEQIAEEIRQQLDGSGLLNPSVTVEREGDRTKIEIMGECDKDAGGCDQLATTRVTIDGKEPGSGTPIRLQIKFDKDNPPPDAEIEAEAERQLKEQGVNADVTVRDGKIVSIDEH